MPFGSAFGSAAERFYIASVSSDGNVLLWSRDNRLAFPQRGYRLPPSSKRGDGAEAAGGTAIAFAGERYNTTFIAGTEGGNLCV